MREKYVDERFPSLFEMCRYADGRVLVTTVDDAVSLVLSPEDAESLLAWSRRAHGALVQTALAFDDADHDAFGEFWYGKMLEPTDEKENSNGP